VIDIQELTQNYVPKLPTGFRLYANALARADSMQWSSSSRSTRITLKGRSKKGEVQILEINPHIGKPRMGWAPSWIGALATRYCFLLVSSASYAA
jgi:hypothetical protein